VTFKVYELFIMKIDKIFIINLDYREDRRESAKKQVEQLIQGTNLTYEFFITSKPLEIPNDYLIEPPAWFKHGNFDEYRRGSYGCMQSHLKVIELAKERGYTSIMILEDDIGFSNVNLTQVLKNVIIEVDMLYLSGRDLNGKTEKITEHLKLTHGTMTTGGYIVNEKAMNYILKHSKDYKKEIDLFYSEDVQQKLCCCGLHPYIGIQLQSYSDILNRVVKYF
jgi:GR25 family glycosyltransferase involved in LPS biosynthesis